MTQSTGPNSPDRLVEPSPGQGDQSGYAHPDQSYAYAPSYPYQATAETQPPQYAAPQYAAPQYAAPQYAAPQYAAPQYAGEYPAGPTGIGGAGPTSPRRDRRRPGWLGVIGVGVGSAVLASGLTVALVGTSDDGPVRSQVTTTSRAPAPPGPVTGSNAKNPDWPAVAAAVEQSVVAVKVAGQGGSGEGSGVLMDTKGNVLTNNHVVAEGVDGGKIQVVLSDGRGFDATVVGTDPQTDLAVIRIKTPPSGLRPATLGDSTSVRVGDPVMAVGNPLGLSDTVTTGIISAVDRPVTTGGGREGQSAAVFTNAIQTDAAINPGNSGGALVDVQGRVVGINSSIASLGAGLGGQAGSIGLGFAIPVNEAKDVADQLLADGKVDHAFLGVTLTDGSVVLEGAQRQSAQIGEVTPGGPAEKAGVRTGDQVIGLDGEMVGGADSLIAQIRERRPGTQVTLTVVRDGKSQDVQLTLGTRPNN